MKKQISFFFVLCLHFLLHALVYAKPFTIAVVPDPQGYINYYNQKIYKKNNIPFNLSDIFTEQINYIKQNSFINGGTIVGAVCLGDIVEHRSDFQQEWQTADDAMSILDGTIPFSIVPGNHDYDKWEKRGDSYNIVGTENFNKYFGANSKHFQNKAFYLSYYNGGADSLIRIETSDGPFLILGFECEPDDKVLEWANKQLEHYNGIPTILVTHIFLASDYSPMEPGKIRYSGQPARTEFGGNLPQNIWDKFISLNDQIFLVLCGHVCVDGDGERARVDINNTGNKVYQLLSDYQGRRNVLDEEKFPKINGCGDGWLRLLEFDLDNKRINVKTYSTLFKKYEKDYNSEFIIKLDFDWNERFRNK